LTNSADFQKSKSSTPANSVIPKLDIIFSRQGIPKVVESGNGAIVPSFLGFEHRKFTYWPQTNGEVERFMREHSKKQSVYSPSGET
jgi:hypothetical protein